MHLDILPLRNCTATHTNSPSYASQHTIARYYNTSERMTVLFRKITNKMIWNCRHHIIGPDSSVKLWDQDIGQLITRLQACLALNEFYQEHYYMTRDKLLTQPKGKQFDFNDTAIFGKFDLFCRRIEKLQVCLIWSSLP